MTSVDGDLFYTLGGLLQPSAYCQDSRLLDSLFATVESNQFKGTNHNPISSGCRVFSFGSGTRYVEPAQSCFVAVDGNLDSRALQEDVSPHAVARISRKSCRYRLGDIDQQPLQVRDITGFISDDDEAC